MPVVINEFEVVPEPQAAENQTPSKKKDETAAQKPPLTDYEVKQLLERRTERLERISAH
jgi:hypothetical protein